MTDERFDRGLKIFRSLNDERTASPAETLADLAPDFGRMTLSALGDFVGRPGLDVRTREIATVCMLSALGHCEPQLQLHIGMALRAGAAPKEIVEACMQVSGYAGYPRALNALAVARRAFEEHGVTVSDAPREVVLAFVNAFQSGDLPGAIGLLADDIVLHVPGERAVIPWAGTWRGRDEVVTFLKTESSEAQHTYFRPGEPLAYHDRVFLPGAEGFRFVNRNSSYEGKFVAEFAVRQGRITLFYMHHDSAGISKAYTGGA
ncbi:carboxymuconolactone decarboxylase family protein [Pendulispora rubella]|uniref:Carboxymuconolactone decarboxylase family protein n=1 Tax=Pendulispora rubella TaxID=2741070 RepID=A0ABZ2L139_9BACT